MKEVSQKNAAFWAMMCHLSSLVGFIFPGFGMIIPLLIWGLKREQNSLIMQNGRNVINFILSFWVYSLFFCLILFFSLAAFLFFSFEMPPSLTSFFASVLWSYFIFYAICGGIYALIYFFFHGVLAVYGGIKALNYEVYRYPLTIQFLKESPISLKKSKSLPT